MEFMLYKIKGKRGITRAKVPWKKNGRDKEEQMKRMGNESCK